MRSTRRGSSSAGDASVGTPTAVDSRPFPPRVRPDPENAVLLAPPGCVDPESRGWRSSAVPSTAPRRARAVEDILHPARLLLRVLHDAAGLRAAGVPLLGLVVVVVVVAVAAHVAEAPDVIEPRGAATGVGRGARGRRGARARRASRGFRRGGVGVGRDGNLLIAVLCRWTGRGSELLGRLLGMRALASDLSGGETWGRTEEGADRRVDLAVGGLEEEPSLRGIGTAGHLAELGDLSVHGCRPGPGARGWIRKICDDPTLTCQSHLALDESAH